MDVNLEQDGIPFRKMLLDGGKRRAVIVGMHLGPLDEAVLFDGVLELLDGEKMIMHAVNLALAGLTRRGRYRQHDARALFQQRRDERPLARPRRTRYDIERSLIHGCTRL